MNLRNVLFIILIGFLGRMFPHPDNMTPFHAICLLTGLYFPTRKMVYGLFASYVLADIFLAYGSDFPIWGSWSFYTCTGMLGLVYLGIKIQRNRVQFLLPLLGSLFFWVWTNLGVWLHSKMYVKSMEGLISCYLAAVPFLQKSLLGDLIWFSTLSLSFPWIISTINSENTKSQYIPNTGIIMLRF